MIAPPDPAKASFYYVRVLKVMIIDGVERPVSLTDIAEAAEPEIIGRKKEEGEADASD